MHRNHAIVATLLILALLAHGTHASAQDAPRVLQVFPGKAPGEAKDLGPEKEQDQRPGERQVIRLTNVSQPTLTVYAPPKDQQNGTAVVICPGGGYNILAMDLEGTEVAQWLNKLGVTAIVLKYRVPKRSPENIEPRQDAQRAMRLVRSKATELGIDPQKIGILGFSAGGHLAAMTAMHSDKAAYEKIDEVDAVSARPDFVVLVYPAYLTNREATELTSEVRVDEKTPPMFLAHAGNDPVTPMSSVLLYAALKKANVPAELHVYSTGGHGFGLRPSKDACSTWPARCEEWLRDRGLVK